MASPSAASAASAAVISADAAGDADAAAIPVANGGKRWLSAEGVVSALRSAVDAHRQHSGRLAQEVGSLLPYLRTLAAAGGEGVVQTSLDHSTVQQNGFDLLNEVMSGKSPQCCICCAPATAPCITLCMHLVGRACRV
jgi:E3 ubiquitin-protein ligase SHPRH